MAKAQREWAEALAATQAVTLEEVTTFANSVTSSAAAANGTAGGTTAAAASLEAVVPLALFLSKSQGKYPEAVVPHIAKALQAVVWGLEATGSDAGTPRAASTTGGGGGGGFGEALPGTPPATGSQLPESKWSSLLAHAMAQLAAVLGILPLSADWKAQISSVFRELLLQLLLALRRQEQHPMLSGLRAVIVAGRQRLPLTGADAAQLFIHIAERHLGLIGGLGSGLVLAGSWRSEGELPWALASQLAPLALQSGQLSGDQAGEVALGACGAIEQALKPVLQQDDSASEPSVHGSPASAVSHASLPTPAFVNAMAALAARTAVTLSEPRGGSSGGSGDRGRDRGSAAAASEAAGRDTGSSVLDTLLTVCEDSTAAASELGVSDRASHALLNIAMAVAQQLLPLLTVVVEGSGTENALQDLLPRLQAVLAGAARLAELEYLFPGADTADDPASASTPGPRTGTLGQRPSQVAAGGDAAEAKVKALWVWDLSQDLSEVVEDPTLRNRRAWKLTRALAECTATLLAACWQRKPAELTTIFVPLAGSALERQEAVPVLGRMLALTGGDEDLARLLVPLLRDALASQSTGADAEAYAVAAHCLASMAVCCAVHDKRWGYDQIVDLLLKLYKFPNFSISRALLHGTGSAPTTPRSPAAGVGATPRTPPEAQQGPDVPIVGRCPGALADALVRLAEGMRGARVALVKDLRTRLFTLFSDFALILPNGSYVRDLGALLPALGAVGEAVCVASSGRMSVSASATDLSLDALNTAQEEDLLVLKLFRQMWLYVGVYDFAGLQQEPSGSGSSSSSSRPLGSSWPADWQTALGRVAAVTPLLIVGREQHKLDELLESLTSEFGSRLAKLGALGQPGALMLALSGTLGGVGPQLPAPMAAHLLTQATKSLCRARFSTYEACALEGSLPIHAPLHHLQLALPGSLGYSWQQMVADKVFAVFTARLAADRLTFSRPADMDALDACAQQLAQVLVGYLVQHGPNAEVPRLADRLLSRLLDTFPALHYKREVLAAVLQAATDEDAAGEAAGQDTPRQRLAFAWLGRLLRRAAQAAPGPIEACLAEEMRRTTSMPASASMDVMGRYMPEMLQLVRSARAQFPMAPLLSHMVRGVMAWSTKLHFLGRVAGLAESAGAEDLPSSSVPLECAKMLSRAVRQRHTDRAVADTYLQAAAALVQYPGASVSRQLLRLLCWVPVKRFSVAMMQVAVLAWHWVLAAAPFDLQVALLSEIASAWEYTIRAHMGLFSSYSPHHAEPAGPSASMASSGSNGGGGTSNGGSAVGDGNGDGGHSHVHTDAAAAVDAIGAHHLWVAFLWEVSEQHRHDLSSMKAEVAPIFWHLLQASLDTAGHSLTAHPASTGARFRLLHLALRYCHAQQAAAHGKPCPLPVVLMYEQVLAAALQWFELPEAWHDADRELLREALGAVKDFGRAVEAAPLPQLPRDLKVPHPVWGAAATSAKGNAERQALLVMLLSSEVERLAAWADPLDADTVPPSGATTLTPSQWAAHVRTAWTQVSPRLAVNLARRFPGAPAIKSELQRLVVRDAGDVAVQNLPEAAPLLATPGAAKANAPQLQHLAVWAPLPLLDAIALAAGPAGHHPAVLGFVMRSLEACRPEEVAFFLPQLVQLLRYDQGSGVVERFLLDAASRSVYFAHMLVCQLLSEGTPPDEAFNPAVKRSNWSPPTDTGLWQLADRLRQRLLSELHGPVMERLSAELEFFDEVTAVSGKLYPVPKDERRAVAVQELRKIRLPRHDLYIPTNPDCRVLGIIPQSAAPMQSAAKCPILVAFRCEQSDELGSHERDQACIFKVGDDCRQDVLALQVMRLMKGAFDAAGLPLYMAPYGVVPTGHEQGIIEVIPQAKSRAQLGEMFDGGLFEIFQHEFGMPGARRFEAARRNFLESTAAYSVASYILWAKDRHNGNLMLDNQGRFLHIDFGYILGISPGGNLGFETAPFKLSYEMTQLLDPGGTRTSDTFKRFMELTIRGFLAARSVADSVVAAVAMMAPSQLPCFGYGKPVENLRARFKLELSDAQAAAHMKGLILGAYDKWTTGGYDYIQYLQNAIPK